MTRDDIIRMAREAGGREVGAYWDMTVFMLERFAALVAAAERTTPPRREWVGLTDEDMVMCESEEDVRFVRAIEDKLKEKNQ